MKKHLCVFALLMAAVSLSAQGKVEYLPFGNMDRWTVRNIKESKLIGGETKSLYLVGPKDTIQGPTPFPKRGNSPWGTSNAYAKVMGVEKVSVNVTPERRGNGYCCRMENVLQVVKTIGINFKAFANGSLYTGKAVDPLTSKHTSNPYTSIDMGIPFKKRPKALVLDYKAHIANGKIIYANAGTSTKELPGKDAAQITVLLQHRWEENGHIYAYRVGTGIERITHSVPNWVNGHRVPIRYGDITKRSDYKPYEALFTKGFMARNSAGKMVYIEEKGWRDDVEPTHIIVQISSGCQQAFTGCPGNIMWCDNIGLVYE